MRLKPSYKPLRKILVDRDMKPSSLYKEMGVSRSTASAINQDRFVAMETIAVICNYLNCGIEDVVEFVDENGRPMKYRADELL
ncbi:helix-turn-helix domain-containing protein [Paenibacillus sp. J5C2022]|uniref:helix-turn-helix domain-containing protein n=1 Tax=Paenibacillus sp. J5C2022 TaxID=2977129 RepID=UPI00397E8906